MIRRPIAYAGSALFVVAVGILGACGGSVDSADCTVKCNNAETECVKQCNDDQCKSACETELNNCTASCSVHVTTDGGPS